VIWTAIMVYLIDRKLLLAAAWGLVGTLLAGLGMIHQSQTGIFGWTDLQYPYPEGLTEFYKWRFAAAYATLSVVCLIFHLIRMTGSTIIKVPPPIETEIADQQVETIEQVAAKLRSSLAVTQGEWAEIAPGRKIQVWYDEYGWCRAEVVDLRYVTGDALLKWAIPQGADPVEWEPSWVPLAAIDFQYVDEVESHPGRRGSQMSLKGRRSEFSRGTPIKEEP